MTTRTVCLAFDSADVATLRRGVTQGWLPNVGRLVERGRATPLDDNQRLFTIPSWPTLVTASTPDAHRMFGDRQLVPGSYVVRPMEADESRRPPFWALAGAAGLHTTAVGVYAAPYVADLPGVQVLGWGTHDPFRTKLGTVVSHPPSVLEDLNRVVGERNIAYGLRIPQTAAEFRSYLDRTLAGVRQQTRGLLHLLRATSWDLFLGGWAESHEAGHFMWHLHDPLHPRYDPSAPAELRDGVRRIYEAIDAGLGELVAEVGSDVNVVVISPYGLGPDIHGDLMLDPMLEAAGYLKRAPGVAGSSDLRGRVLSYGRRAVHRVVPPGLRPALGRLVPRDRWVDSLRYADVDWTATSVFTLPTDGSGAIRLNLAGREPGGIVEPGAARDRLVDDLTVLLQEVVAVDDGEPVVDRVVDTRALWADNFDDGLPDVAVEFRQRYPAAQVRSARIGTLDVPLHEDPRTGLHDAPGMVVVAGPDVVAGPAWEGNGRLIDVGPTVLNLLGVEHATLPGRALYGD